MAHDPVPLRPEAHEQRRGLRSALEALDSATSAPTDGGRGAAVLEALAGLRAAWDAHTDYTEAPDGMFADVMVEAPHLAHAVERLRGEHADVDRQIDLCEATVRDAAGAAADDSAGLVIDLRRAVERHVDRGVALVYDAYSVDVSVGD